MLAVTDKAKAGFASVQLGFERQRSVREDAKNGRTPRGRRATKAEVGHAKKAGLDATPNTLREFKVGASTGEPGEPGEAAVPAGGISRLCDGGGHDGR